MIVFRQRAVDRGRVDEPRVVGIERDVRALASADVIEVVEADAAVKRRARDRHCRVVLLPRIEPVWHLVVGHDAVELRGRLVVDAGPGLAAVERDRRAAVVAVDHVQAVVGVDPVIVVVAVRQPDPLERFAAIDRLHEWHVQHPDGVLVQRIGRDMNVVPGARPQDAVVVDELPGLAVIIAAPQAALVDFGLDNRVNAVRAARGDRDANLADEFRQAAAKLLPGIAAVGRFPDAARRATRLDEPRSATVLPHRGIHDARICRVHGEIRRAGLVVHLQHGCPGLAAIAAAVDAAFGVRAPDLALHRDIHDIGIRRVNDDLADLASFVEPQVRPAFARVGGLVYAVAVARGDAANRRLARTDVDDVRVGGSDADRADRADIEILVREVFPGDAGVLGLPHAAAGRAHVIELVVAGHARYRRNAAAAPGADLAPLEAADQVGIDGVGGVRRAGQAGQQQRSEKRAEETGPGHCYSPSKIRRNVTMAARGDSSLSGGRRWPIKVGGRARRPRASRRRGTSGSRRPWPCAAR